MLPFSQTHSPHATDELFLNNPLYRATLHQPAVFHSLLRLYLIDVEWMFDVFHTYCLRPHKRHHVHINCGHLYISKISQLLFKSHEFPCCPYFNMHKCCLSTLKTPKCNPDNEVTFISLLVENKSPQS